MICAPNADQTLGPQYCGQFDFTLLFEQSCLQIIPCAIFLLSLPVRLPQLYGQSVKIAKKRAPSVKIAAICLLASIQLALLVLWSTQPTLRTRASIPATVLSLAASVALVQLSSLEHARSIRPSSIINVYILFSMLLDLPQARTLWIRRNVPPALPAVFTASVVTKGTILFLEARGKQHALLQPYRLLAPELLVNIYDRTVLWWLNPLFFQGYFGNLSNNKLYVIDNDLAAEKLEWKAYRLWKNGKASSRLRLATVTFRTAQTTVLGVFVARVCLGALRLSQPLLIGQITLWLGADEKDVDSGHGLILATALLYLALAFVNVLFKRGLDRLTTKMRAILISTLHAKSLSLPSEHNGDGALASFLTADLERIAEAIPGIVELFVAPLEVGATVYLLEWRLGLSCVAPVALAVPVTLAGFLGSKQAMPYQLDWLAALENRIAYTATVLGASKTFKMLGMTDYLIERIQSLRVLELSRYASFRKFVTVRNMLAFVPDEFASPVTLTMYTLLKGGRALTPTVAFTALSLVQLLILPIHETIQSIPGCMNAIASFKRIEDFLLRDGDHWDPPFDVAEEPYDSPADDFAVSGIALSPLMPSDEPAGPIIQLQNVTALLGKENRRVLDNVSLAIAPRSFTTIVGPVGSGKSTLLHTLIGDVCCSEGQRNISRGYTEFAYCAQDTWLSNETIRDIIVGVTSHEEGWYQSVLKTCALQPDIDSFARGDNTVVGSKGISLSGGQQQRIALARALYTRKRVLVLDDALSGVDARTSARIMTDLRSICKRNRITLILVTHVMQHLSHTDHIVVMNAGRIVDQGSLDLLRTRDGYVRELNVNIHQPDSLGEINPAPAEQPVPAISSAAEVEDEQRLDLARRTGDFTVYKHYVATIGWKFGSIILLGAAIMSFGQTFSGVVVRWWSEDETLLHPQHSLGFWIGICFTMAVVALSFSFIFIWVFLVYTVPISSATLHRQLLERTMKAPYSFFVKTDTGYILNLFATDMSLIETELASSVIRTLSGIGGCIGAAILIAAGTEYAGLTMPFVVLVLYGLQSFYLRTSRQLRFMQLENQAPLLTHCQETQAGVTTIRAMGWQRRFHEKCITLLDRSQRPYYLLLCVQRWLNLVLDLVTAAVATILVTLAITMSKTASAGSVGLSLLNIISFNARLSNLIVAWSALETSLGAVARCRNYTRRTPFENLVGEVTQPPEDWPARGSVQLSDLSASYTSNGEPVLKKISLKIPAGTKVGICGRSGSGKSSLLLTLVRMLDPSSGRVEVDDIDLTILPRELIRKRFTTLPQATFCLPGSVRANLDPIGEFSDIRLLSVLANVHLSSHIASRESLETEMSSLGLSQGEMQLFAVARALLKPSALLLVDEMTSAVDSATEKQLLEVISAGFRDSTVIAVAHRLPTIVDFDMVVVMDSGSVVEVGAPRKLLARPQGVFRSMWKEGRYGERQGQESGA